MAAEVTAPIWPKGTPGSDEAVKNGCICGRVQNQYGDGFWEFEGEMHYDMREDCPVHGWSKEEVKDE